MERLQIIRETINYARQFHDSRIVVKLDDRVAVDALERGIFSDIYKIRQAGIEVMVAHSSSELCRKANDQDYGLGLAIYCQESAGARCDNAAVDIALEQKAQKLIFVTNAKGVFFPPGTLLRQISVRDARELLAKPKAVNGTMRGKLEASIKACSRGIDRVHIIGGEEGNLLLEIFTCDGVGTMISETPHKRIRMAETGDVDNIMEILRATISRSCFDSALVAKVIGDFWVFSVDEDIHGCMQLLDFPDYKMIEISCLAVTARYENLDVMQRLLKHAIECAGAKKCKGVFISIKENTLCLPLYPWFMRLGFKKDIASQVPRTDKNAGADCWVCPTPDNI